MKNKMQIFEQKKVRSTWDEDSEKWLKNKLKTEGCEVVSNANQPGLENEYSDTTDSD